MIGEHMFNFNPLIEKRINEGDIPDIFKEFIKKILLLELQTISEGTRWRYTDEFNSLIVKYAKEYLKDSKNEI